MIRRRGDGVSAGQGGDLIVRREELLRLTRGLEASHGLLSSKGVPVRGFGPIVQPLVLAMFNPGGYPGSGRSVGTELVQYQHARLAPTPEQLSKEVLGGARVPKRLKHDVQYFAIGVDRPPEPMLLTFDRDDELVEMPFVYRVRAFATDPTYKLPDKARGPVPHGLVRNAVPT